MTDQGPMQPDYRRRMEAAEARVKALEAEMLDRVRSDRDDLKQIAEGNGKVADAQRERADAAEQRVKELEAERNKWQAATFDAEAAKNAAEGETRIAEAREQALRDERDALRNGITALADWCESVVNTPPGVAPRLRALLSPPTADTQPEDKP